jgi:hypothetical protein
LSITGRPHVILRSWSPTYVTTLGALAVLPLIYGLDANARTELPTQKVVVYVFPQDLELRKDEAVAKQLTRINYAFARLAASSMASSMTTKIRLHWLH